MKIEMAQKVTQNVNTFQGLDENTMFDKIRMQLNLGDFVRVDEVQDAFAKLTESF